MINEQDDAGVRDCFRCGSVMEKKTEPKAFGGFGSTGVSIVSTNTYCVCPKCGRVTRDPNNT
jgi:hypothetical protein